MILIMNKKQQKFLKEKLKSKKKDLKRLKELFNNQNNSLDNQIKAINDEWGKVVSKHNKPLRLVILAEAPLSSDKYFYNNTGTFLNGLKDHYILNKNCDLPAKMLEEGILLVDIYKLPIPSEYYRVDNENYLFDPEYFKDRITSINKLNGKNTKFVFRYTGLFKKKKLHESEAFDEIRKKLLMDDDGNPIQLFSKERPQTINPIVKDVLKQNK